LYQAKGFLSGILINETEGMASASVYSHRFGSLPRAYTLIGFTPDRDYGFLEINRLLRRLHPEIVQRAEAEIIAIGGHIQRDVASDLLRINDEFTVSIVLARCLINARGGGQWKIRLDTSLCPDITIAVRLDQQNAAALDYYLLPWLDLGATQLRLRENNGVLLDGYRFDSLDMLYRMAARSRIRRAA